jgi:hypothetical protein
MLPGHHQALTVLPCSIMPVYYVVVQGHSLHTAYTVHVASRNSVWMHDAHAVLWMRAAGPARSIHQHSLSAATMLWMYVDV